MEVTETLQAADRDAWRHWLEQHHESSTEIWLVSDRSRPSVPYLEVVEEALCFGWIDGIAKKLSATQTA